MNRVPARGRPAAEPVELAALRGWLRGKKAAAAIEAGAEGKRATFQYLADRACAGGSQYVVSACTLRQALDGRLPTLRTTLAFIHGAGGDEKDLEKARLLWEAAERAVNPPRKRPAPHVPGLFTTPAGLVRAMNRVRATAPHTSLRALAGKAGPGLALSTLHRFLTGRQMPTAAQLERFAAACDAGDEATAALLAGHQRILTGPPLPPSYPCAYAEWAEERRQRDKAARPWLAEPELDWYDQQLRDAEEAELQRLIDAEEAFIAEWEAGQEHTHGNPGTGTSTSTSTSTGHGPGAGSGRSALGTELAAWVRPAHNP
ncbi:helix-turn-helix domain-containing protein [Streptomyces gelaticus]|uniref:helix-turn-helix domain-containing protein n=1 Tax=Streptomyces gelaticus TaxID=285446 RepID=UPI003796BE3D